MEETLSSNDDGERKLPYRPDLWEDPETGEPTPHRAALGYLFCLLRDGFSDEEAADELLVQFRFFEERRQAERGYRDPFQQALNFVRRNRRLVERYLHQHEKIRASKDHNFKGVLAALKHAGGTAKARELKVVGQGKGGRHATFLSPISIERHLRRARKLGLVTVDRYGVWRLVVDQTDHLTAENMPPALPAGNSYKPDLTTQAHISADLLVDQQANAGYLLASRALTNSSFKANYASRSSVNNYANDQLQQSRAEIANSLTQFPSAVRKPVPAFSMRLAACESVPASGRRGADSGREFVCVSNHVTVDCERTEYVLVGELMRVLTEILERLGVRPAEQSEACRDDAEAFGDDEARWAAEAVGFLDQGFDTQSLRYDEKRNRWLVIPAPESECVRYEPASDEPECVRWGG